MSESEDSNYFPEFPEFDENKIEIFEDIEASSP